MTELTFEISKLLRSRPQLGLSSDIVTDVGRDSMRVVLDGKEREIGFNLRDYGAVDYGYAATVHKAQGVTVDCVFVLATPGMDRHLTYVSMTRHRNEATLHAGRDDFKDFASLKERLSRARPKDSTLDYATRRGLDLSAPIQEPGTLRRPDHEVAIEKQPGSDLIERFRDAQQEFIKAAGHFDLDLAAKARAAELREEMKQSAQKISRHSSLMHEAERAGIASQVKSLVREADQNRGREMGEGLKQDAGLER